MDTGNGYDETEEENELDAALLELEKEDESELKAKLKNVEHVLIQAKTVSLTEGMEELEKRAALYRLASRRRQPDGEQLDQAKQLWERAQSLRDKQETKIQQLQESLDQAKDKLKLQEKQVGAAKAAYEEVRMKLQNPKPAEPKTAASADPGEVTQKTLTALAAKVPAFEGAITAGELQSMLLQAMHQTADEMKGSYTSMERWEMKPVTFQFGAMQSMQQPAANAAAALPAGGQAVAQKVQQVGQPTTPAQTVPVPQAMQQTQAAPLVSQNAAQKVAAAAGSKPVHPVMLAAGGQSRSLRVPTEATRGRSRSPTSGTGRSTSITAEMVREWT